MAAKKQIFVSRKYLTNYKKKKKKKEGEKSSRVLKGDAKKTRNVGSKWTPLALKC